jgi:hypothetical protein
MQQSIAYIQENKKQPFSEISAVKGGGRFLRLWAVVIRNLISEYSYKPVESVGTLQSEFLERDHTDKS